MDGSCPLVNELSAISMHHLRAASMTTLRLRLTRRIFIRTHPSREESARADQRMTRCRDMWTDRKSVLLGGRGRISTFLTTFSSVVVLKTCHANSYPARVLLLHSTKDKLSDNSRRIILSAILTLDQVAHFVLCNLFMFVHFLSYHFYLIYGCASTYIFVSIWIIYIK